MRSRVLIGVGLLTFLSFLGLTAGLSAVEYHVRQDGRGDYTSLQAMLDASAPLSDGDVIVLYNDDSSLTNYFDLSFDMKITIRSGDGNAHRITPASGTYMIDWRVAATNNNPQLVLDRVHFDGKGSSSGVASIVDSTYGTGTGRVGISNSVFENFASAPLSIINDSHVTITNSEFLNNSGTNVLDLYGYGNAALDVNITSAAKEVTRWKGATGAWSIAGTIERMNFDIAAGKKLDIADLMNVYGDVLNKNGAGTLRIEGNRSTAGIGAVNINNGTLHFGNGAIWYGDTINVGSNGVFKVTYDPGNVGWYYQNNADGTTTRTDDMTRFSLTEFHSEEGARTVIGNISMHPTSPINGTTYGAWVVHVPTGTTQNSTFASSMNISNRILKATWKSGASSDGNIPTTVEKPLAEKDEWFLHIEELNDLATLDGVGSYADVYRHLNTLTPEERDMLDNVYCSGASGSDLAHIQTIGGHVVQYSSLAMRHNFTNLLKNISKRHTKIQQEELEAEVTGSSWCYSEENDQVGYGELWAYIDQTWHSQDDVDSVAGYKYNPYGIGIGYDKHIDEWIYGGVLRYDNGKMKLKSSGATHTDVETILASGYVSWASDGYYITGGVHLGYGWNETASSYTMPGLAAVGKGKYHTSLYGVNTEFGYMFNTGSHEYPLRVTPYGGIAYARIERDGFHEKGAGNLDRRFYATDWDMWDMTAGVRVAMPLQREGYTLIPSVDIAVARTLGEPESNNHDVTLISNPLGSWKVTTLDSNRTALRLGAGLNARFNRLDIGAAYEFEWRKKATAHQLNLNMSLGF